MVRRIWRGVLTKALKSGPDARHAWLAVVCSFVLLGGLRVMITPVVDDQGAFPDEVYHFARGLHRANLMAETFALPELRFSESGLEELATGVDDICHLGVTEDKACATNSPVGNSGEVKQGLGVYVLHGLAQLAIPTRDTHARLLFGRLTALLVGVALALVVFQTGSLVFNSKIIGVVSAALTLLMPSVNHILSAVSTEGPALLVVAFLLWASANIYIRGPSIVRVLILCLGLAACPLTKVTALIAVPAVVLLCLQRMVVYRRGLILVILATGSLGLASGLSWTTSLKEAGVANWYIARSPWMVPLHGSPSQLASNVLAWSETDPATGRVLWDIDTHAFPLGKTAISTTNCCARQHHPLQGIVQFLPSSVAAEIASERVTVGSWVIAPPGTMVATPGVVLAYDSVNQTVLPRELVEGNGHWQFVAYEIDVPAQVQDIGVILEQAFRLDSENKEARSDTAFDGVTLSIGSFAESGQPPSYDDEGAKAGKWGGVPFVNLLKNGSGEVTWMTIPQVWFGSHASGTWANRANAQLFSLYDLERTFSGYVAGLRAIFVTFWGSFMGGDVPGLARWHYGVAIGVLVLASLGWAKVVLRDYRGLSVNHATYSIPSTVASMLVVTVVLYGLVGVARMEVSAEWVPPLFYSTARFILPAIIPMVLLSVAGACQFFPKRWARVALALLVACVYLANTWMLLRVEIPYYTCPSDIRWDCTHLSHG